MNQQIPFQMFVGVKGALNCVLCVKGALNCFLGPWGVKGAISAIR
jgi:hypothetical protein